jgi:hypothetical protein
MKITGEQIAEQLRAAGKEVQYFPLQLSAPNRSPFTMGSYSLNTIAEAVNAIPGIAMIETMELVGVKGGKEIPLGEAPLSPELKAREICRQYGEDPDDEDSLIMGALMELINWQNKQRIAV